jgi:hypothetical protein
MNKKMNLNWSVDEITGNMPDISSMRSKEFQVKETSNTELLKDYLKRLGNGEDLESVKKDFVPSFISSCSAFMISEASTSEKF